MPGRGEQEELRDEMTGGGVSGHNHFLQGRAIGRSSPGRQKAAALGKEFKRRCHLKTELRLLISLERIIRLQKKGEGGSTWVSSSTPPEGIRVFRWRRKKEKKGQKE